MFSLNDGGHRIRGLCAKLSVSQIPIVIAVWLVAYDTKMINLQQYLSTIAFVQDADCWWVSSQSASIYSHTWFARPCSHLLNFVRTKEGPEFPRSNAMHTPSTVYVLRQEEKSLITTASVLCSVLCRSAKTRYSINCYLKSVCLL